MENVKEVRFSVKWNFFDVVFLLMLYYVLIIVCVSVSFALSASDAVRTNSIAEKPTTKHPLTQLIQQSGTNYSVLLFAFLSGVITAPLAEEFLFRLVLQCYLEKLCLRSLRITNCFAGIISIAFTSLLFASLHGSSRKEMPVEFLQAMITGLIIGSVLFLIMGITYLTVVRKSDAKDLGWDSKYLLSDIKTAAVWALFVIPAVMLVRIAANFLLPYQINDPIPLFFFSLVLGFLFYKTRRLAPCVILHLLFNGFSFTMLLLLSFFG